MSAGPEVPGRVVVVHGRPDTALEHLLRLSGLIPRLEVDAVTVWGPSAPEPPAPKEARPARTLLTIAEAAVALSIGRSTVYELIGRGELEVVHLGRSVRVPADAINSLIDGLRSPAGSVTDHKMTPGYPIGIDGLGATRSRQPHPRSQDPIGSDSGGLCQEAG